MYSDERNVLERFKNIEERVKNLDPNNPKDSNTIERYNKLTKYIKNLTNMNHVIYNTIDIEISLIEEHIYGKNLKYMFRSLYRK